MQSNLKMPMLFSIIIPVYNRPNEVKELLQSLTHQADNMFEVIVVEDGSTLTCENVCKQYAGQLDIKYLVKENSGPGGSRNFGAEQAKGDYLLILDSDCIIPENYIQNIRKELQTNPCDAFGGADAAHESFSDMQKAVNYAMTSFFTTGGIRGGKKGGLEKFHPRSFNMGVKTSVYKSLGGFSNMRYGEDIDFSIRIFKAGHTVCLFPEAYVYHKRRVNLAKFYRQVFHSGAARINLWKRHPESTHRRRYKALLRQHSLKRCQGKKARCCQLRHLSKRRCPSVLLQLLLQLVHDNPCLRLSWAEQPPFLQVYCASRLPMLTQTPYVPRRHTRHQSQDPPGCYVRRFQWPIGSPF